MASGDTLLTFTADNAELPASSAAGLEVVNYRPVIAFDGGSSDESVIFSGIMPQHYTEAGFEVWITYCMASSNTDKKVVWSVDWEKIENLTELASDHFTGTPLKTNPTVPVVAYALHCVVIIFTNEQSAFIETIDDMSGFRIKLLREASDEVNDDATGDAYVTRVEIRMR